MKSHNLTTRHNPPEENDVARLEIRMLDPLFNAICDKAKAAGVPEWRWVALHLAEHLGINPDEGIPPRKPMGRPRKRHRPRAAQTV